MQSVAPIRSEDYDLICPITLRTFQDPVKAADGHTYEREAIVRWITDHGTSPLTRQVLDVNGLLSDHYVREKMGRRASVAGSSDLQYELTLYRNAQKIPIYDKVLMTQGDDSHVSIKSRCCRRRCCSVILILSAIILFVCGVSVGLLTRKYSVIVYIRESDKL
jgi:hypothetical protein